MFLLGIFPTNGIVTGRYKVAVSSDAAQQTYPIDVAVTYENRDGDVVTSASDTMGIPVGGKMAFAVSSDTVRLVQGSENVITVEYKNNGYHNGLPFTGTHFRSRSVYESDDTSFIGDLQPGATASARYQIHADDAAEIKTYLLDAESTVRDAQDNSQVSDTFKVPILVEPKPVSRVWYRCFWPNGVIALIGIGAGYYLLVMRKKK